MQRWAVALAALAALAGCSVYEDAPPETVAAARYASDAPASVTLISMVDNETGKAAHSALLINGSQQVIYDPAGTFTHPELPRAGDVHYGVSPRFVDYYERYHARFSHSVHSQTVEISRAAADQVLANAQAEGRTPKMLCAGSVTGALTGVETFAQVNSSIFPERVRRDFARIAGVQDSYVYEVDIGKNHDWERRQAPMSEADLAQLP